MLSQVTSGEVTLGQVISWYVKVILGHIMTC